jgi:hypothetical protein
MGVLWTLTTRSVSGGREVCREESSKARDLVDAASWLRLADDFENLAARGKKGCGRQALAVRAHEP